MAPMWLKLPKLNVNDVKDIKALPVTRPAVDDVIDVHSADACSRQHSGTTIWPASGDSVWMKLSLGKAV